MSQPDFNPSFALGCFAAGREERKNYLLRTILRLLLIDYIERRHGIKVSINADGEEIDRIIRDEVHGMMPMCECPHGRRVG